MTTPTDQQLIDWYQANRHRLPDAPFDLKPGVRVVGPQFYRALDAQIQSRSNLPLLAHDLQALQAVVSSQAEADHAQQQPAT